MFGLEWNTNRKTYLQKSCVFATVILFVVITGVLALWLTGSHFGNYQSKIYNLPRPQKGVVDFAGYNNISNKTKGLAGEWEFFYNRWIITDNEENPTPDGFHQIPTHWTNKKLNDGRILPNTGYASYGLTIKNMSDEIVGFRIHIESNIAISYRVFVNGKHMYSNGTMSKNRKTAHTGLTRPSGIYWNYSVNDVNEYSVVIEVSDNRTGGIACGVFLATANGLNNRDNYPFSQFVIDYLPLFIFGAMLVSLVFCIFTYLPNKHDALKRNAKQASVNNTHSDLSPPNTLSDLSPPKKKFFNINKIKKFFDIIREKKFFSISKKDKFSNIDKASLRGKPPKEAKSFKARLKGWDLQRLSFLLLIGAVMLHFFFAIELAMITVDLFRIPLSSLPILRFLTSYLILVGFATYLHANGMICVKRWEIIAFVSVALMSLASYFPLMGMYYELLPYAFFPFVLLWLCVKMLLSKNDFMLYVGHMSMTAFLFVAIVGEIFADSALTDCNLQPVFTMALSLFLIPLIIMTIVRMINNEKKVRFAAQTEAEIVTMKKQALKAQIKPHFIFNSLAAVKEIYRRDQAEGEHMLTCFSNHLRANVDSDTLDLIPLDRELKNMLHYFELENIRLENKLTLIMNIEDLDISIPVLSLQPFLENAVKYGNTHEKEDGFIEIKSTLEQNFAVIQIIDNGVGFDPQVIRPQAVGITNAKDRLRYYLNAVVTIESKLGEGTTVTIKIPI